MIVMDEAWIVRDRDKIAVRCASINDIEPPAYNYLEGTDGGESIWEKATHFIL